MAGLPSPVGLSVMQHLLRYRFLTIDQFQQLGISCSERYLQKEIQKLRTGKTPLLAVQDYGKPKKQGYGRLKRLHWLSSAGASFLAETGMLDNSQLPYLALTPPAPPVGDPTGKPRDYDHRILFIDCHIAIEQALQGAGLDMAFFHAYFDPLNIKKTALEPAQRMRSMPLAVFGAREFRPDGLFLSFKADGRAIFAALELHRFRDTGRIYEQLATYGEALAANTLQNFYDLQFPLRVLTVLDDKGMRDRTRQRLADDPRFTELVSYYWFADQASLFADARICWIDLNGRNRALF